MVLQPTPYPNICLPINHPIPDKSLISRRLWIGGVLRVLVRGCSQGVWTGVINGGVGVGGDQNRLDLQHVRSNTNKGSLYPEYKKKERESLQDVRPKYLHGSLYPDYKKESLSKMSGPIRTKVLYIQTTRKKKESLSKMSGPRRTKVLYIQCKN